MLWTLAFWKGAAERGLKTTAQTAVAFFVIGTTGLLDLDWVTLASVAGAAGVASVLTSIGNADFVAGTPTPKTSTTIVQNITAPTESAEDLAAILQKKPGEHAAGD